MTAFKYARRLSAGTLFAAMFLVAAATSAQASVEISADPTHNMNCTGGVCSPTAKKAVLNATDLANMLAASDVEVVTGSGAVTITVSSSFSWTSSHRLTLDANLNVSFRAPVVVAGQGAITIVTNDGGTGGDLIFFPGGKLDFWDTGSSLIIDGNNYTLVQNIEGLASDIKEHSSGHYALAKDYDASQDGSYRYSPVRKSLHGVFEGLGHTISNLNIEHKSTYKPRILNLGLFESIAAGGMVRDIGILNSTVVGRSEDGLDGLLAGYNNGTILHSSSTGMVQVSNLDGGGGGLVGHNGGTIRDSYSAASVGASYSRPTGGLAGGNSGTIDSSYATGRIGGGYAGGLVSDNSGTISDSHASGDANCGGLVCDNTGANAIVENCFATGNVSGTGGGLVGFNGGLISGSYAMGNVAGNPAGGLVSSASGGTIQNSYAFGSVSGGDQGSGGLIGKKDAYGGDGTVIQSSYAIGAVSGFCCNYNGGVVGENGDQPSGFQSTYWDETTSQLDRGCGFGSCTGIIGLTDTQLKAGLPAGFDPAIWGQSASINNGYPYLLANPPPQ